MESGYKVSDIMTANPLKMDADLSARDCAEMMNEHQVGSILITKGNKFAGIVTEEDLVQKVVLQDLVASKVQLSKIMTPLKNIISIEPNKDIQEAIVVMKENDIRRLPVMNGSSLQGLITSKDILRIQPELFELLVETFELREANRKLQLIDEDTN